MRERVRVRKNVERVRERKRDGLLFTFFKR